MRGETALYIAKKFERYITSDDLTFPEDEIDSDEGKNEE
jgi:hypothetical protein